MKFLAFSLLVFFILLSQTAGPEAKLEFSPTEPSLLPVPIVRQATDYSCGTASLLSVLYYWKMTDKGELNYHEPLSTHPDFGTHPTAIVDYCRLLGLQAELSTETDLESIEAAIDRKEPVIIDFQAWTDSLGKDYSNKWDNGHYAVIVGYDQNNLYLMDPVLGSAYGKLEKSDFLNRWHDVENRDGEDHYYIHPAIFISGKNRLKKFPSEITQID
jgi:uncharacterized protein